MCLFLKNLLKWKAPNAVILPSNDHLVFSRNSAHLDGQHWSLLLARWTASSTIDRSALGSQNLCYWTHAYPSSWPQPQLCSRVYHVIIKVADDRSWLTSTGWVILPTWLFCVSSVVDALLWVLMCTKQTSHNSKWEFHDNSHWTIYMSLTENSLVLTFPSVSIRHCPIIESLL